MLLELKIIFYFTQTTIALNTTEIFLKSVITFIVNQLIEVLARHYVGVINDRWALLVIFRV